MPIETRDGHRVLIHEVSVAEGSLTSSLIASYESLLGAPAVSSGTGSVELEVGRGVIVRVGRTLAAHHERLRVIAVSESCENVMGRIRSAGASVFAWFSLRRAWMLDGEPESDARGLIVRDGMGAAWWFRLRNDDSHPRSTLPVSDVKAALAWYPSLFSALGWGDRARQVEHGACVDLVTNRWDARLFPRTAWSLDSVGIERPTEWDGSTGEVSCDDPDSFEETRRRLEGIGLMARAASETFLALTDPFGHEWYVGLNTAK
jgi:hypothetical protein